MPPDKQTTYWFIESADATINVSVLYETLKQMNLAVEPVDFPDPLRPKDPSKRHYAIEVKFRLVKMIASKKIDLKGLPFHIWRRKGSERKMEMVDHIFKTKLSAKSKEIRKKVLECSKRAHNVP